MWERDFFIHPAILRIRQFISKWGLYHPDTLRLPRDQRRKDLLGLLLAVLRAVPWRGILRLAVHRHHLGGLVRLVADPRTEDLNGTWHSVRVKAACANTIRLSTFKQ